jgi:hypothetical protein
MDALKYASWVAVTEVASESDSPIIIQLNSPKRACLDALATANTLLLVDPDYRNRSIQVGSACRTHLHTRGLSAVYAYDWYVESTVRDTHYPNARQRWGEDLLVDI